MHKKLYYLILTSVFIFLNIIMSSFASYSILEIRQNPNKKGYVDIVILDDSALSYSLDGFRPAVITIPIGESRLTIRKKVLNDKNMRIDDEADIDVFSLEEMLIVDEKKLILKKENLK